jgi:hypothetical protein
LFICISSFFLFLELFLNYFFFRNDQEIGIANAAVLISNRERFANNAAQTNPTFRKKLEIGCVAVGSSILPVEQHVESALGAKMRSFQTSKKRN